MTLGGFAEWRWGVLGADAIIGIEKAAQAGRECQAGPKPSRFDVIGDATPWKCADRAWSMPPWWSSLSSGRAVRHQCEGKLSGRWRSPHPAVLDLAAGGDDRSAPPPLCRHDAQGARAHADFAWLQRMKLAAARESVSS